MELNLTKNAVKAEATTQINEMQLSPEAKTMIFRMFSKGVYSNPIGTVVREITSNCFDSHVEAGVKTPVVIRKVLDKDTGTHSISFIDYGVGISPDRMKNMFSVYFNSTKRKTNNEIGGWGIGGKSPLAYHRVTGLGEDEFDNSYSMITNFDGIKYQYAIFFKDSVPQWTEVHREATTERNGTEISVPMLERDVTKFEDELIKQLYYFEDIVFEGWSDRVQNDYKIIRGKNFLHRGTAFSTMHVCLGRV